MCYFVFCLSICAKTPAQTTPYAGFINSDQVAIRSGPGQVHYATTYLKQGEHVEVWRHDPGGWCAIRPPDGSYCLVPARQVEMTGEPGVGRISQEGVLAWVGTNDGSVNDFMWQVRLHLDELVEVLGESTDAPRGNSVPIETAWYKIAPPAGEFRWVQEKYITRQPFQLASNPPAQPTIAAVANEVGESDAPPLVSTPTFIDVTPGREQTAGQPSAEVQTNIQTSSANFDQQVRSLDIALSKVLAQNTDNWQFDALREQATAVIGRASTDVERGQALRIVNKIDEFDDLKRKLESNEPTALPLGIEGDATNNLSPTLATRFGPSPLPATSGIDPRFHGVGWLVKVRSPRQDVPQFALTDENGRIRQYVSPSAGFNLNRYLKKEVGIYGQRGFIESLKSPHVTALRVVELDRHRR